MKNIIDILEIIIPTVIGLMGIGIFIWSEVAPDEVVLKDRVVINDMQDFQVVSLHIRAAGPGHKIKKDLMVTSEEQSLIESTYSFDLLTCK